MNYLNNLENNQTNKYSNKVYLCIARVSDESQMDALPAQKLSLQRYIEQNIGQSWDEAIYREFNESAYKDDREKFGSLIKEIEELARKQLVAVVFDKIDRFTRDVYQLDTGRLVNLAKSGSIELHFPSDGLIITKDSPAHDFMRFDIGAAAASYYSRAIRDNVNRRIKEKLANGEWIARAPLGYLNKTITDGNGKKYSTVVIDESRRHYIERIFDLRIMGYSYSVIAKVLNDEGLRTREGNRIQRGAIERILHNPFYCGILNCGSKNFIGRHKYGNIISEFTFNKARELDEPRRKVSQVREFTSVVKCKNCGTFLTPYTTKGNQYFRCNKRSEGCTNKNISARPVIETVNNALDQINIPEELLPVIIESLRKRYESNNDNHRRNLESARKTHEKADKALTSIGMKLAEGSITLDEYNNIANIYRKQKAEANEILRKPRTRSKSFEITESYLLDLLSQIKSLYDSASDELKNKLLIFLGSNFTANGNIVEFEMSDLCKSILMANKKGAFGTENAANFQYGVANRT